MQDKKPRRAEHMDVSMPHGDWPGHPPFSHYDSPGKHTDKVWRLKDVRMTPENMIKNLNSSVAVEELIQNLNKLREALNNSIYSELRRSKNK